MTSAPHPPTQLELLCGNAVIPKGSSPKPKCVCAKPVRFYLEADSGLEAWIEGSDRSLIGRRRTALKLRKYF